MPVIFFEEPTIITICAAIVAVVVGKCMSHIIITHGKRRKVNK